ncbi:hypothetical protein CEXT_311851 [Caerostris extrusa]|uniref:Yippee domain-containing protein n=1 Tax=Caerostris extrusa TaxID=172846 RepID=A0AAV4R4H4_CAEEX|nr:hypothetical protein CEXT_311851 [Caerostris extrusa]
MVSNAFNDFKQPDWDVVDCIRCHNCHSHILSDYSESEIHVLTAWNQIGYSTLLFECHSPAEFIMDLAVGLLGHRNLRDPGTLGPRSATKRHHFLLDVAMQPRQGLV